MIKCPKDESCDEQPMHFHFDIDKQAHPCFIPDCQKQHWHAESDAELQEIIKPSGYYTRLKEAGLSSLTKRDNELIAWCGCRYDLDSGQRLSRCVVETCRMPDQLNRLGQGWIAGDGETAGHYSEHTPAHLYREDLDGIKAVMDALNAVENRIARDGEAGILFSGSLDVVTQHGAGFADCVVVGRLISVDMAAWVFQPVDPRPYE